MGLPENGSFKIEKGNDCDSLGERLSKTSKNRNHRIKRWVGCLHLVKVKEATFGHLERQKFKWFEIFSGRTAAK